MLIRFHLIPERYGRTGGQICYINIAHQHTALLTRDKNCPSMRMCPRVAVKYEKDGEMILRPGAGAEGSQGMCPSLQVDPKFVKSIPNFSGLGSLSGLKLLHHLTPSFKHFFSNRGPRTDPYVTRMLLLSGISDLGHLGSSAAGSS